MSLPSRERGLKFGEYAKNPEWDEVAPLAGAWIEMVIFPSFGFATTVAPLAGAWIEIAIRLNDCPVK